MRVALVVERFVSTGGGVEGAAWRAARELAARDLDVTVVCRFADAATAGVAIEPLGGSSLWQPLRITLFSERAARATRSYDIVHGYSRTRHQDVYRAGGGSHAAYMERVYARPGLQRWSPRHLAILRIEEAVFRDARQVIQCNSHFVAKDLRERYDLPEERLVVIYNGVDTDRFHPRQRERHREALRRELGLEGPVALFAGSGFARKGLDRAIRGLADSGVHATLLVAGGGDASAERRLAEERGVAKRVRFLGLRRDVEALHAASDLFVLPTRYDPFANACLEAMASGLPVATTPDNGASEMIEPGRSGWIEAEDFAPAFAALARPEHLVEMGRTARATAEQRTWGRHADEVIALYRRILAERSPG